MTVFPDVVYLRYASNFISSLICNENNLTIYKHNPTIFIIKCQIDWVSMQLCFCDTKKLFQRIIKKRSIAAAKPVPTELLS